jgi:SAM-dependent methyltransferase
MNEAAIMRGDQDPRVWFREHFDDAAEQVLAFLDEVGGIANRVVADIGCGDGMLDLGLVLKGKPQKLVGYDIRATDTEALARAAVVGGVAEELPEQLSFATSTPDHVPSEDDAFDVVVTWSVFEHVARPVPMLNEIYRILKPDGVLFLQLWPFFYSEHGGHLWPHYDEPFPHLVHADEAIRDKIRGRSGTDRSRADAVDEYDSLNRITLDQLHAAILATGMIVTKLQVLTEGVHIPRELAHLAPSLLGIGGVKLLAVRR